MMLMGKSTVRLKFKLHKKTIWLCLGACIAILAPILAWIVAPYFCDDPMAIINSRTPVRTFYDINGQVIHMEPTYDFQWRFDIPLEDVSPFAIRAILDTEDTRFFQHGGVDYKSTLRAACQNLFHRRIVSGASTISMQLVSMSKPRKRSYWNKILQATEARRLEQLHSKDEILQAYLNHLPFGGKIYGIQAASQAYFGVNASQLNRSEATLLAGIPQRPNAFKPNKYLQRARRRQITVLNLMLRNNSIAQDELIDIIKNEPLRMTKDRSYYPIAPKTNPIHAHYINIARQEAPNSLHVNCAIDTQASHLIHKALVDQLNKLPDVNDAAAVLIHNATRQCRAIIGTVDFSNPIDGQVNAATAIRSAGSTLKPFIFLESMDAGLITADTILNDAKINYSGYAPGNYSGQYSGKVRAAEALAYSLNTPAVNLLKQITTQRMIRKLNEINLVSSNINHVNHGLALALGTVGHSLLNLTNAYSTIPNQGFFQKTTFLNTPNTSPITIAFSRPATQLITQILTSRELPQATFPIAWKTGTSTGNHDAWCIAFTPEYTIGIWVGNKNGKSSASLVGATAAIPPAVHALQAIYKNSFPRPWQYDRQLLPLNMICAESGLAPTPACKKTKLAQTLLNVPLAQCKQCTRFTKQQQITILSPRHNTYLTEDDEPVTLNLEANLKNVIWFIDGQFIGTLPNGSTHDFTPGRHTITAVDPNHIAKSHKISFAVDQLVLED